MGRPDYCGPGGRAYAEPVDHTRSGYMDSVLLNLCGDTVRQVPRENAPIDGLSNDYRKGQPTLSVAKLGGI